MNGTRPDDVDALLREALTDLDRRMDAHVAHRPHEASAPAFALWARLRASRWAPALAGMAVAAVVLVGAVLTGGPGPDSTPQLPAGPTAFPTRPVTTGPSPVATVPPDPNGNGTVAPLWSSPLPDTAGPSQSAAEAARDGVPPAVAALTLRERVILTEPLSDVSSTEVSLSGGTANDGLLVLSSPPAGTVPGHSLYSEIVLLSNDHTRILRAVPFPELPAQWITAVDDTVYCGRQGDGGVPSSMLCRLDLKTFRLTGRVFPSTFAEEDPLPSFDGWRGAWSTAPRGDRTGFDTPAALADVDPVTLR